MTKDEALKRVEGYLTDYLSIDDSGELEEIMKALEQQPITDVNSNILHKIAEFFSNWDGDENAKMEISVEDMREISSMFVTKCRAESKLKALEQQPEDAINRQVAIDIVRHECGEWKGLAKEIVKQFNELPSVQPKAGHWVPVSEGMPNEFADVICCTEAKEVFVATYLGKLNDGTDCFDDYDGMMWEGDIIAWMPLPEPFEPQKVRNKWINAKSVGSL